MSSSIGMFIQFTIWKNQIYSESTIQVSLNIAIVATSCSGHHQPDFFTIPAGSSSKSLEPKVCAATFAAQAARLFRVALSVDGKTMVGSAKNENKHVLATTLFRTFKNLRINK